MHSEENKTREIYFSFDHKNCVARSTDITKYVILAGMLGRSSCTAHIHTSSARGS